jgi:hypothetical protein
MLERYGVENPSQSITFVKAKKRTTLKNYGVEHHSQTQEYREEFSKNNPSVNVLSLIIELNNNERFAYDSRTDRLQNGRKHTCQLHEVQLQVR